MSHSPTIIDVKFETFRISMKRKSLTLCFKGSRCSSQEVAMTIVEEMGSLPTNLYH